MPNEDEKQSEKEIRKDGYKNLMNKYGTKDDVSEQYKFVNDEPVPDIELTLNYEENGLFAKIIDIPSDDAVSSGFSYGISDTKLEKFINKSLEELNFEEVAATAIKWSRLYGGAVVVMMIDDGKKLTDPIDWDGIQGIDELLVFERPLVTPDYNSIYRHKAAKKGRSKFGQPEYYDISPMYGGTFRVHESRCLLFRNGSLPSLSSRMMYRFFGLPEYIRIHKSLQETVTSHGNGVKLLDRAVQAIYKMKDLAALLATETGEDIVLKRLQIIDLARGILNSLCIDADGEDYDFKSISFSGVKDIIDSTCNMLSAVTQIPQTKLFGRSPAGENSTGESDMENYYKFVGKIQKINLKNNLGTIIDIILIAGKVKGEFEEIPDYELTFKPLWSLSESEQATINQTKATTELTKAQTAQIYVDMQALDASEVRSKLAEHGEFTVNDILDEVEEDWNEIESEETNNTALTAEIKEIQGQMKTDSVVPTGCGVIVVKDGKILIGTRKDNGLICGPGGHIENGETPEEAAIRESREEFGIYIAELIPVTILSDMPVEYCPSQVFLCTKFFGNPIAFNDEMENARFEAVENILKNNLFLPFKLSILELLAQLHNMSDEKRTDRWITTKSGKHIEIGENGELLKGHPASIGGKEKIGSKKSSEKEKQNKNAEKKKKSLKESENSGNIASAKGANILEVKGFKNKQHLNNHWQNGRTHQKEYAKDGITTKEQYAKRAVELAEMPTGNGILGYKTKEGYICRYDSSKNDYVKADIKKGIRTMFKPDEGEKYYQRMLEDEGVEDD